MARLNIRVQPGASRSEIVGFDGDVLRLRVTARPIEGRANEAVIELVAAAVGVPKSRVSIDRGQRGRQKVLLIDGLEEPEVSARVAKRLSRSPSSGSSAGAAAPPEA